MEGILISLSKGLVGYNGGDCGGVVNCCSVRVVVVWCGDGVVVGMWCSDRFLVWCGVCGKFGVVEFKYISGVDVV